MTFDLIDGLPESPLDAALYYARLGIPVFPCEPETKKPLPAKDRDANGKPIEGTGGHIKATTREETIRRWWARWPNAWIGYPTGPRSGIDVLDLDRKHGKNGFDAVPEWRDLSPIIISTPNDGAHDLFGSDGKIRNTTDKIALGVDSRGDGGYALLPGAGGYRFIKGGIEDLTPERRESLPVWPEKYRARANGADKSSPHVSNAIVETSPERIRAALAVIPNDARRSVG